MSSRFLWIKNPVPPEIAAIAGPLLLKMLPFILSDRPLPEQKHHDSFKTPIILSLPPSLSLI
ncbi:hypothetical protein PJP07_31375, partial [Mycobacterium kansasii]